MVRRTGCGDQARRSLRRLLSNTLPARGLFHDHPFGLGITGSYFTALGREMYESADVVLAVGTSLSYYVGGGHFWPKAYKIQLDDAPRGLRDGLKAADLYVRSDALIGIEAILAGLDKKLGAGKPTAAAIRTKELAHRIATEPADSMEFDIAPGVLDPREAIRAIDAVVPKDWDIVVGGGHQAYFNAQMRGRPAERYTTIREFGAVGNGLSYALGVAAARRQGREGKVVLFEGDGGLLFHIQELETLKRHGYRILICAMNDGGYGSSFTSCAPTASTTAWLCSAGPRSKKSRAASTCAATRSAMCRSSRSCSPTSPRRAKAKSGTSKSPTRSRRR